MRKVLCSAAVAWSCVAPARSRVARPQLATLRSPVRLENLRQLTHGGENAEAYWAPDGKRLIFQSTRDGHDCDQQYIMNADGSDPHLVSTGKGVTTCGYFLSDNKHILYASTHEGSADLPGQAGSQQGLLLGGLSRLRYLSGRRQRQDHQEADRYSAATMPRRR